VHAQQARARGPLGSARAPTPTTDVDSLLAGAARRPTASAARATCNLRRGARPAGWAGAAGAGAARPARRGGGGGGFGGCAAGRELLGPPPRPRRDAGPSRYPGAWTQIRRSDTGTRAIRPPPRLTRRRRVAPLPVPLPRPQGRAPDWPRHLQPKCVEANRFHTAAVRTLRTPRATPAHPPRLDTHRPAAPCQVRTGAAQPRNIAAPGGGRPRAAPTPPRARSRKVQAPPRGPPPPHPRAPRPRPAPPPRAPAPAAPHQPSQR
jgi:hypothetical protein